MSVAPGSRLGPYEISSRLGAGGMGEVWRAKDTRLDRSVAIKILPEELKHHAQLRLRLEREAKTISQLNHPHICTLYDVGDDYLVMELLDGDTLADKAGRGPLPIADVLRYGHQIADALDRAHRAGIVHRDLKPGNIMITKSGAKLLDFGLARSELQSAVDQDGPTIQVREALTEEGTVLGTFQYMAPEQLEAQPADARTDIFALGCVLYEMATGRRAFQGKTRTSLIAAIVGGQPQPISALQPVTPRAFEHVVQKCLEKDPDARWQSAHDVAEELRWIARELEREDTTTRARRPVHWSLVAALLVLAIALGALWIRERMKPAEAVAFSIAGPSGGRIDVAKLSPDGRSIALVYGNQGGKYELVVRRLELAEPVKVASLKDSSDLTWSPDGKSIAYFEDGRLLRIPSSGGRPETICSGLAYGSGVSWNEDDVIVFAPRFGEALFRVAATGGKPERLTKLDPARRESLHGWPHFLPGGKELLFIVHTVGSNQNEIHIATLDGKHQRVMDADSVVGYARGSIVFVRDGAMYAQKFDAGDRKLEGEPRRIAEGVMFAEASAHAHASVSHDGAVSFFPIRPRVLTATWHDRTGQPLEQAFEETNFGSLRFSRDGSKLVMTKWDAAKGAHDIYTRDLARGIMTRVTAGRAANNAPVWAPAGDRIYFQSDIGGLYDVYAQVEDGTAAAEVVWRSSEDKSVNDVSSDGRFLIGDRWADATKSDLWLVPLDGSGAPRPYIASEAMETGGEWSPDGKWLAYASDRSGAFHLYVRRFPNGRSVQVSTVPGVDYRWGRDGSELLFQDENRTLYAIPLGATGDVANPGAPRRLFTLPEGVTEWTPNPKDDRLLLSRSHSGIDQVPFLSYIRKEW